MQRMEIQNYETETPAEDTKDYIHLESTPVQSSQYGNMFPEPNGCANQYMMSPAHNSPLYRNDPPLNAPYSEQATQMLYRSVHPDSQTFEVQVPVTSSGHVATLYGTNNTTCQYSVNGATEYFSSPTSIQVQDDQMFNLSYSNPGSSSSWGHNNVNYEGCL